MHLHSSSFLSIDASFLQISSLPETISPHHHRHQPSQRVLVSPCCNEQYIYDHFTRLFASQAGLRRPERPGATVSPSHTLYTHTDHNHAPGPSMTAGCMQAWTFPSRTGSSSARPDQLVTAAFRQGCITTCTDTALCSVAPPAAVYRCLGCARGPWHAR